MMPAPCFVTASEMPGCMRMWKAWKAACCGVEWEQGYEGRYVGARGVSNLVLHTLTLDGGLAAPAGGRVRGAVVFQQSKGNQR